MSDNIITDPEPAGTPIGHQIRHLRKTRGWSLAELARRAGTSAPSLHRYENGWDRFEVATLRRIAGALGTHLEINLVSAGETGDASPPGKRALVRLISPLFWDRNLEQEDLGHWPVWVIGRVLMFGNMAQAKAVRRFYGDEALRAAVAARGVDKKTRTFWSAVLGEEINAPQSPRS